MAELTQEQKDYLEDQQSKFGEIFSQCWESEEFKKGLIADPKAYFEEYGIDYDKNYNYVIIDTPPKTIINVLPYKGVKVAIKDYTEKLLKNVEDIEDDGEKQVLLPGWCWQTYQNTADTVYLPIPISPETLTPEELEMINGGCFVAAIVWLWAISVVGAVAVAGFFAVAAQSILIASTAVTFAEAITAQIGLSGSLVFNWTVAVDFSKGADTGSSTNTVNQ